MTSLGSGSAWRFETRKPWSHKSPRERSERRFYLLWRWASYKICQVRRAIPRFPMHPVTIEKAPSAVLWTSMDQGPKRAFLDLDVEQTHARLLYIQKFAFEEADLPSWGA